MLSDVVGYLRCPHCHAALVEQGRTLRCRAGHSFDVARHGYVSLLPADAGAARGDGPAMVAARERFLAAGHYDPLSAALAAMARDAIGSPAGVPRDAGRARPPAAGAGERGCVVDLGAGTGHHLARVLDALPAHAGLALDSSKHALRRAARAHPRVGAVACDAWRSLPLRDDAAALALSVFAPRDAAELARVLAPGATLLAVTPTPAHLAELVAALELLRVDPGKPARLDAKLAPALVLAGRRTLEWELRLDRRHAADAAAMGPTARHTDPELLAAAAAALPEPFSTTAAVTVSAYREAAPTASDRV